MSQAMSQLTYSIKKTGTDEYLSLMSVPHFTENSEIISSFDSEKAAMMCIEMYIDSDAGYEAFGMIDTEIVPNYPCMGDFDADGNTCPVID